MQDRARRGALLLDQVKPGWASKVEPEELEMGSCCQCLLGHVYGEWEWGVVNIGGWQLAATEQSDFEPGDELNLNRDGYEWSSRHGFGLADDEPQYLWEELADIWRDEIRRRTTGVVTTNDRGDSSRAR
jgi:hypothetical protein